MRLRSASAILMLAMLPVGPARAEPTEQIGATVHVVNLVTAEINRDTRSLAVGDAVHQDENIEVGLDALGELRFDDDTKLALGPGSRLKLDTFVYDPAKSSGTIVLNLAKGTFRFITGSASKPSYKIQTPQASISVRGTIFDVFIEAIGRTWLLLHEGGVEVCSNRGKCRNLDEPGKIIRVDDEDVGAPLRWAGLGGSNRISFDDAFPFVSNPPRIDPAPALTREAVLREADPEGAPAKETDEPKKPPRKAEKRTPPKQATVPTDEKPKGKKKRTSKVTDAEAAKAIGIAIGVGIAIGGSKIGGGGKHRPPHGKKPGDGGKHMPY